MASPTSIGWATALASLGQAVPGIARQYNTDTAVEKEVRRKSGLKKWGEDVFAGMPQYGSVLEEMAGGMSPEQAQQVLANTPEPEKQAAAAIVSGKQGLDSMRMAMPKAIPEMPMPEGGALGAMLKPKLQSRRDVIESIRPVIRDMESGGRYNIPHPRTKSGKQALGAYGIVPEIWFPAFPDYKLDPSNAEHRKRFLDTPAIQDAMFAAIADKGLEETGGDLRKFRAWYYGGPGAVSALDTDAANRQEFAYDAKGNPIPMPSRGADADDFMKRLEEAGVDPSVSAAASPTSLPWDNSLLSDMVKDRPKMATMPRKVTYGDQEKYLLSKVKNPEQYGQLKDMMESISGLAKSEREQEKDRRSEFGKEEDRYNENVRKDAQLKFDTWKEKGDRANRARTYRDQSIAALRAQRDSMQKQLQDIRGFQTRVASGKESPEVLAAAYPNFFSTRSKDPGVLAQLLQGGDAPAEQETAFDSKQFGDEVKRLEADIQAIDEAMSSKSGAPVSGAPEPARAISKYLIPRSAK